MCASLGQPAWNPGCIIADEVFSQDSIPKFSTVNQRTEQNLLPPHPCRTQAFVISLLPSCCWLWSMVLGAVSRANPADLVLAAGSDICGDSRMDLCTHLHQGWGKSNHYITFAFAAHSCSSGLECSKLIMSGTRSQCARAALCYICVLEKWGFSVLRPELRSTWCSLLVLLWFLELLFLELQLQSPHFVLHSQSIWVPKVFL